MEVAVACRDNPFIGRCADSVAVIFDASGRITLGTKGSAVRSLRTNASRFVKQFAFAALSALAITIERWRRVKL